MNFAMIFISLALACLTLPLVYADQTVFTGACYSSHYLVSRLRVMRKQAGQTGLSKESVDCLSRYAIELPMTTIVVTPDGKKVTCLPQVDLVNKMARYGIPLCIPNVRDETTRMVTVRVPYAPDTMVGKVANALGIEVRASKRYECDCFSGCHFCCLQEALSGESSCFQLWCSSGWGMCGV